MPPEPLKPFAPPTVIFPEFPTTISPYLVLEILFGLTALYWILFTGIAIYHWIKYSHASAIAYPAIATHIVVSLLIMTFALSGFIA